MSRFNADTVSSSGQVSNTADKVQAIQFHARSTNGGSVIVGISTVSSTRGRELTPDSTTNYDFGKGSVPFNVFFVNVPAGNQVDWEAVFV